MWKSLPSALCAFRFHPSKYFFILEAELYIYIFYYSTYATKGGQYERTRIGQMKQEILSSGKHFHNNRNSTALIYTINNCSPLIHPCYWLHVCFSSCSKSKCLPWNRPVATFFVICKCQLKRWMSPLKDNISMYHSSYFVVILKRKNKKAEM